ncbi:hypothetical protein D917_04256 [Trichinella nativa]|uniref:Uncharacterized protein n=1 Tax=Trichinella nativa TaxID=6335 RepID=A0A1Y3E544_9BILA|nr:hypothetical protein D917_04256 [Trichinella nativa]
MIYFSAGNFSSDLSVGVLSTQRQCNSAPCVFVVGYRKVDVDGAFVTLQSAVLYLKVVHLGRHYQKQYIANALSDPFIVIVTGKIYQLDNSIVIIAATF